VIGALAGIDPEPRPSTTGPTRAPRDSDAGDVNDVASAALC